jgi:hypothetical protein
MLYKLPTFEKFHLMSELRKPPFSDFSLQNVDVHNNLSRCMYATIIDCTAWVDVTETMYCIMYQKPCAWCPKENMSGMKGNIITVTAGCVCAACPVSSSPLEQGVCAASVHFHLAHQGEGHAIALLGK